DILRNSILADLTEVNPDLTYTFGGEQQQQIESLGALYRGFVLAMLLIFALLAIPLRSYTKPFVVMAIIPFALIGVILGHLILGISMSAASFMGFFGLAGVIVNDSLVMIDFIEQRIREGAPLRTAIIDGAKGRFRPIALTSVTTFLGFTPLILEPSIQAQFLVPFAASLGVGMLITTALLMMLVPALMAIYLRVNSRRLQRGAAEVQPAVEPREVVPG
ncbi:MAG: efflux RND transporter permease subunit, partial [Gammaproteobacteria bacterium]|nr:efflux RND transporter permease subunit [Gammaproteobacteria bacterium]